MKVRVLRNLILIAEYGSIAKAADAVHLTSQALGVQLRKVEQRFGFPLFERNSKGLVLTYKGQTLLPHIREVVATAEHLEHQAGHLSSSCQPLLRVALNSTFGPIANLEVARSLRSLMPEWGLKFTLAESDCNRAKLERSEADLAIMIGRVGTHGTSLELTNAKVDVVLAINKLNIERDDVGEPLFIAPAESCPYSELIAALELALPFRIDELENAMYSESEALTVEMIKRCGAMGVVSQGSAARNDLRSFGKPHTLKTYVNVVKGDVDERIFDSLNKTLDTRDPACRKGMDHHAHYHGGREIV